MRSLQHRFHLIARERFGQNLPLFRRVDVQSGIVIDEFVEKKIAIKMPQRESLRPTERPSTELENSCWMKSRTSLRRAFSSVRLCSWRNPANWSRRRSYRLRR